MITYKVSKELSKLELPNWSLEHKHFNRIIVSHSWNIASLEASGTERVECLTEGVSCRSLVISLVRYGPRGTDTGSN